MSQQQWTIQDIPDQTDRIIVITGANSGLGYETALGLAHKHARVVLACRDTAKGDTAKAQILAEVPQAQLEVLPLNLADLASVRAFADHFKAKYATLDLLINNAGVMALPRRETADGFEMQFGTNHLGHFALTGLLLDPILKTAQSRIVTVSSLYHKSGQITFDDLQRTKNYKKWQVYAQSKLANLLFTLELQRRLAALDTTTISVAAHPGYAATNLQLAGPRMLGSALQTRLAALINRMLAQSAAMGALPTLYAATAPNVQGGDYIGPDGFQELRGYPTKVQPNAAAQDRAVAARLWTVSAELTGVSYAALTQPAIAA